MKERIIFVDNLRALLILVVVLGHCLQYTGCNMSENVLYNVIQSFQMPLFMFVSGFVSFKDTYSWSWLLRRCKRLVIPFIVGTLIMSLSFREGGMLDYFIYPLKGLWFLWVLAVLSFLQYFTSFLNTRNKRIKNTRVGYFLCLLVVFALASVCSWCFKSILCFDLVAFHFIFYFTGYYFNMFWTSIKRTPIILIIVLFLVSMFLSITFKKNIPSYFVIKNFSIYVRSVCFIITVSYFVMSSVCIDKKLRFLQYIGSNTLGIYAIHRVMFEYRPVVLESGIISYYYPLCVFILFVLMIGISMFLVELFSKNRILSAMFLGK